MRSIVFIAMASLWGCATDTKSPFCHLSSVTSVDDGVTTKLTYHFENKRLKRIIDTSGRELIYEYTASGDLAKETTFDHGQVTATTYTHDDNHFLVSRLYAESGDTISTTYWYNETSQFVRAETRLKFSGGERLAKFYHFYPDLVTHNPSTTALVDNGDSSVSHYEYDDKINPYREFYLPTIQTDNNITKITGAGGTIELWYTYDDKGYPLTSNQTMGLVQTWTYACEEL